MIIGDMQIRLSADMARLSRDMDAARQTVSAATSSMARAADAAKSALAGIGLGMGLAQVVRMSDEYAKFTAQLKLATSSTREYAQAYADVKRIANTAQADLGATGVLYARIANGTRELGVSQQKVAAITETVNLALKVSGATTAESASAMLQLSQAFASGTLRGEEFNAVNEAAPGLMKILADGIGVPMGALKQMASEGKITSQIMAEVFSTPPASLQSQAKEIQTIAGAFVVLKNKLMEYTGIHAEANGTVAILTRGIGLLANNLTLLMGVLTTLTAVKLGTWAAEWVATTYRQIAASAALRAATLATIESELASAGAKIAQATATNAIILVAREEALAKLASSQANIVSAETAIAAATAAGAQSFALRTLRLATAELAVAEAGRAAMIAEMALLGQQQARVTAQLTAATAAQTAAQAALNGASGAGVAAAGLGARALGFLGGPIGALITLLGLAATAWMVWGNKAKESTEKAAESFDEAQVRIVKGLDEQISKNEKLLQLKNQGMTTSAAEKNLPIIDQLAAASKRLNEINSRAGEFGVMSNDAAFFARKKVMQDIADLTGKMAKAEQTGAAVAKQSTDERVKGLMVEHATKQEKMAAELKAIEDLKGKHADYDILVQRIRDKYKEKNPAEASMKAEENAYKSLMTSIEEKIAASALEKIGYESMSAAQKINVKLDAEIETGKTKLTKAEIAHARARAAVLEIEDRANARSKAMAEIQADYAANLGKSVEEASKEADANEELVKAFDKTKSAVAELEIARMSERLERLRGIEMADDEIAKLELVIAQKKRSAAAIGSVEAKEATKKATDDLIAEGKRMADSIENSLTDALLRGFESGKGFGRNLIDTLKNMFGTLVLRPIISAIVNPVAGAVTGALGFSGAANAATSAAGSAAGSALGITGALGSVGAGAMQTAGAILSGQIGLGSTLSAGLSAIGTGSASGIMAGLSSVVGALGPIALGIGAAVALYKHFDTGGTNHSGGAASASSTGVSAVDSSYIGFHLPERNAQADAMTAGLASGIVGILDSTALAFGKTAGYTAATAFADDTSKDGAWGALLINKLGEKVVNWQDTQSSRWAPKEFADGAAGQAQYLAALSASVRTALDSIGLPGWATKMLDSVGAGASIEDLAKVVDQINKTQSALKMMGDSLAGFAALSDKAVTTLIVASGGIDALASNASAYYDAFYTETEKSASTVKAISDVLAAVGVAMPATKEAFRATVEAQMAMGEAGAPAVAALLKVAGAFSQAVPAIEAAGDAIMSVSEIASQQADLQKQFDQLTMTSTQLRAKERLSINASNLALFDQITNLQTIAATSDALKTSIDKLKTFKDGILSFRDSLTLGSLSTLNAMQKAAEAQRQYEEMLAKAKAGDETARAGIQGAATAYLTADQIVKASSDAYVNDAMKVQADMMMLADIAGAQISVDQLQLTALDNQVAGIASLNAEVKGLREDNAKLLAAIEKQTGAVEEQTAAVVTVTLQAADSNAEKVNRGTMNAGQARNYKADLQGEAMPV